MGKKYEYPDGYRWMWRCYGCNRTWSPELQKEFMTDPTYHYHLFNKDDRFTWCSCGCHLTRVSDVGRMMKEGTWKGKIPK
jgi:hypothetical protein